MRILMMRVSIFVCFSISGLLTVSNAQPYNPPERILVVRPTIEGHTERQLRYRPDGTDFVIENGREFFNRPLYGGNTAFRVDAGDMPEFSLYLPGHGGNLRLGIRTAGGMKWLHEAEKIVSRYRPGAMLYEIRDGLLGGATLHVEAMGLYEGDGLFVQARLQNRDRPVEFIAAFGGASGKRGKRGGDIGCESEPVSQFFQLTPENCKDNSIVIDGNTFVLKGPRATIAGIFPQDAELTAGDARRWKALDELLASSGQVSECPVVSSVMSLLPNKAVYLVVKRTDGKPIDLTCEALPELFEQTNQRRRQVAEKVIVRTPDPYINAAASAVCIAADAIWDDKDSVMHGAVAWRSKYLGWRGPYANDVLGWHDRAKQHLTYWATRQNKNEISDVPPGADPDAHYARSHPAKQTNGDIGGRHYDMNLVYMDALFRHVLWTGDMAMLEALWPVIERHMAWERRLFRRAFGDDKLPLYEAYAAIWASDDLQYHGGGVTHASAYNYFHNRLLARFAKALSKDPAPYEQEADVIRKAMNQYLWLDEQGWYAEFRDLLGLQKAHPSAALWTFYHTLDSQAADPLQAWQMSRFVDTQIAHIPVHGGEIPKGQYFTLPTTNWMPYTWSTNNVVMAEVAHTALAYWQAQRPEKAFALLKGCLLDSMYMGQCPGNLGMTTYFDMARGEAQRDFGDGVGMVSRALIEGLFGIAPDVPAGVLKMKPGFPDDWTYASLQHPDIALFDYNRSGHTETYSIKPAFENDLSVELTVKARRTGIQSVTVNGQKADWSIAADAVGAPAIVIRCQPDLSHNVEIVWEGAAPANAKMQPVAAKGTTVQPNFEPAAVHEIIDPQGCLDAVKKGAHELTATAKGLSGHRTVFAEVKQGQMQWTEAVEFEIRNAFEIIHAAEQQAEGIAFRIQNNTRDDIDTLATVRVDTKASKAAVKMPAFGLSDPIHLSTTDFQLLPGSNPVRIELAKGKYVEGLVTNWNVAADANETQWEPVDVAFHYNGKITDIFQNEYLSPRSPYCSLAIPKQGIGSWCNFAKTFEVDDSGLRNAARDHDGLFMLPQGIPFKIPTDLEAKNIVYTSQWENYSNEIVISLSGKARHLYLLMAGSTSSMQSQFDNGQVLVVYEQSAAKPLMLHNPTTWWPIDQDYFIDDYGFKRSEPIPPRVDLKTGQVRILNMREFKGKGGTVPGGAATVLDIPLDPDKQLQSVRIRALANEVVIGLISATLVR